MGNELQIASAQLQVNRLERRTLDGREYAVAPVVAMVAGVRNGELVPADELGKFVGAWDGRPIPLRHPEDVDGNYITANSPDVIEHQVIGSFFNAYMDGNALKGELWLDVAKAQKLGGDALSALNRLERGEVMEVSIAYFCDFEQTAGEFGGEPFSAIQRNLRPDHVALLPDEIGACSMSDGCGANRLATNVTANADGGALDFSRSIMVAFYLREEDAQALALPDGALSEGSEPLPASELHVTLAYLGETPEVETEFNTAALRLADFADGQVIVTADVAGVGRFANAETGLDAVFLLLDSEGLHLFRSWLADILEWDLGLEVTRRWGYIPHVTLGYAPTSADVTLSPTQKRTLVFDRLALSWGEQTIVFPLRGEMRAAPEGNRSEGDMAGMDQQDKQGAKANKANCAGAAVKSNEGEAAAALATAGEVTEVAEGASVLPAELLELAQAVREFGGVQSLMDAVRSIKANSDRQKAQVVGRLAANSRCAFAKADLEAMTLEQLGKLEQSIAPASYIGRNGALAQPEDGEELRVFALPKAGDKKED